MDKVKIELTPYNALVAAKILREWPNDQNKDDPTCRAIHEAVSRYDEQVLINTTKEQLEDFRVENQVNQLIGKSPISKYML